MNRIFLAAALSLASLPAVAGNLSVDFPTLTWPDQAGTVSTSTKGCVDQTNPKLAICKP